MARLTKCKICRTKFLKFSIAHRTCSPGCALKLAIYERERSESKERKAKLGKLKTLRDHLQDTQKVCNEYIRLRDKGKPCISCGRHHLGQMQAGHYRSVGAARHLRFNEDNIHLQCAPCNNHKSGNAIEYRINLVKRIGLERVEALENNNGPALFTEEDAHRIRKEFKEKIRWIKKQENIS